MVRIRIQRLINDYGVKKEKIIEILETNRVTFAKKMKDNSFSEDDKYKLKLVYKDLF